MTAARWGGEMEETYKSRSFSFASVVVVGDDSLAIDCSSESYEIAEEQPSRSAGSSFSSTPMTTESASLHRSVIVGKFCK